MMKTYSLLNLHVQIARVRWSAAMLQDTCYDENAFNVLYQNRTLSIGLYIGMHEVLCVFQLIFEINHT